MTAIATPTRLTEPARPEQAATASTPRRRRPRLPAMGAHVALLVFVVTSLGPILVVIVNSFKTTKGIFGSPFSLPDSTTFSLEGYRHAFERGQENRPRK